MTQQSTDVPFGAHPTNGMAHRRSTTSVTATVERIVEAVNAAGAKVFVVIDHSGEAERVGLSLRETKVVVFGAPAAGTAVMEASPLAALDLPLKVLVWEDDREAVWMSCLSGQWLADRHGVPAGLAAPLSAPEVLIGRALSAN